MPRKSIQELTAQAIASFPDNTTGLITPALLRAMFIDFLNAISPAYGLLSRSTPNVQVLGLAPVIVAFQTAFDGDPAQTTSSTASNTIARSERGTSTINFTADLECQANRFVTFTLYKNGVATTWRITGNGGGAGNPISVALTAIDYADPAATYAIEATCETNGTSVTLSNMALVLAVDPVRSYT